MERREIGFGVVGLGMGQHHCKAIIQAEGAKLVAVCDIDLERLNKVVDEFNVKGYEKYEDMLKDPEVEVVNVCTPSGMHVDMALQALDVDKHIIVEKPVDVSVEKVDKLIEAAKKKPHLKLGAIFQSRTVPMHKRIRKAIEDGRFGKIVGAHALLPWWRAQSYYEGAHGEWKGTWSMDGGGSLMNQGVHTVDLIQWLVGPVKSVTGSFGVFGHKIEAEDQTVATLEFECGAIGVLATTTCAYPGLPQMIVIYGEKGTIVKEEGHLSAWKVEGDEDGKEEQEMLSLYGPKEKRNGETTASDPMAVGSAGHVGIVEDVVEAIWKDRDPIINIQNARHAVQIVTSVYEAGRTGKRVYLS